MAEQTCPKCRAGNPTGNRYCGQCGASLRHHELVEKPAPALDPASQFLSDGDTRKLAQALALSVGVMVAEAAVGQLRQRLRGGQVSDKPVASANRSLRNTGIGLLTGVVVMVAERQIIELQDGRPVRQLIERRIWRKEDV